MTKPIPFSGGCACEAIRYQVSVEPVVMLHCHCRDCQFSSGGPFSSLVAIPKGRPLGAGVRSGFTHPPTRRAGRHIAVCGAPILVDPSWSHPQMDMWTTDAHEWDKMEPALPKFERYPQ